MSTANFELNYREIGLDTQKVFIKLIMTQPFFCSMAVKHLYRDKELNPDNAKLKQSIFWSAPLQWLFEQAAESQIKRGTIPSIAEIKQQIILNFGQKEGAKYLEALESSLAMDSKNDVYFKELLKAFIQISKAIRGTTKFKEIWGSKKKGEGPLAAINAWGKSFEDVKAVSFDETHELTFEKGFDIIEYLERTKIDASAVVSTGITQLDDDLLGGLERATLTIVLGEGNAGKSLFCISLGAMAARQGKRVFHLNLESKEDQPYKRYLANLSNVPFRAIKKGTSDLSADQQSDIRVANDHYDGLIVTKTINNFKVTIEEAIAVIKEAYQKKPFDYLIVDYPELLDDPDNRGANKFNGIVRAYRAMDSIAKELNIVCVCPAQVNREGAKSRFENNEKNGQAKKVDPTKMPVSKSFNLSGAYEIFKIAETFISVNRTPEEAMESKLRLYMEKSRSGEKDKTYWLKTNFSCSNLITGATYDPYVVNTTSDDIPVDLENDADPVASARQGIINLVAQYENPDLNEDIRKGIGRVIARNVSNMFHGQIDDHLVKIRSTIDMLRSKEDTAEEDIEENTAIMQALEIAREFGEN